MNWAEAAVIIVIASIVTRVIAAIVTNRRDQTATPEPQPDLRREVDDLRNRVRVLERIITDERKTRELADDIERLR